MQSTAEFHDQIADPFFPQANPVFDDAAALGTAVDMVDPQPTLVELLVRHVLLPRELLPQIEINSNVIIIMKLLKRVRCLLLGISQS